MSTSDGPTSSPPADVEQQLADLVEQAEAAHAAMYDCRPSALRGLCDDALALLGRAARLAGSIGDIDRAIALTARGLHIRAVYRQLRT